MIRIEKHNAHGLQLVVSLKPGDVPELIKKLTQAVKLAKKTKVNHYAHFDVQFEDDNNRWESCSFVLSVDVDPNDQHDCIEVK